MAEEEDHPVSFSFSGCGFLGIYHIGVVACLREHAPHLLVQARFAGASAGSLIAACVICNIPLNEMADFVFRLAKSAGKHPLGGWEPYVEIEQMLRQTFNTVLPENAHELCTDRLFVSTTHICDIQTLKFRLKNEIVSKYKSKADLIDVLMCSSFVPFFSAYSLPEYNGNYVIDGGLTNNIPKLDKDTITVCPLFGEHSICPHDEVGHSTPITIFSMSYNVSHANAVRVKNAFYAPSYRELLNYCWQGYDNALTYLMENGLIHCRRHRAVLAHLRHLQSCGRDCHDCLHNRDHARHARLNEEALGQNSPGPEKLNSPSHYLSTIIRSALGTTVSASVGAAMWVTKKYVSTFSSLFLYVLRAVRDLIQELFLVAYLAPSQVDGLWTREQGLMTSIFSVFKQRWSLQAWSSWAYEVSVRLLLNQVLFWSKPTGMLLSKVMHIAQQFKAFFCSMEAHYVEPCSKCLRSLSQAPGMIIGHAEDMGTALAKSSARLLQLTCSLVDLRVVDLDELSKRAIQLLAKVDDVCFQSTVFLFGKKGGRCLRQLQKFFLVRSSRVVTVVSDFDFTREMCLRARFAISNMEEDEMSGVHDARSLHAPFQAQAGNDSGWGDEVIILGETKEDGPTGPKVISPQPAAVWTPNVEEDEVHPVFALGDVDFADVDDLNQIRLAIGVGMAASQSTLSAPSPPAAILPPSSRELSAAQYAAETPPGKVRCSKGTFSLAREVEEVAIAVGDATFDQMTEEEQATAAAAIGKNVDVNLSFSMKIQVETRKMVVPVEDMEGAVKGAVAPGKLAVPTLAEVKDFCFKESSQRQETGDANGAEADAEREEEEERKQKERVHEYIHRFEGYHPVMTIHYTDETGKQHSQSLFVNENSSSDEERENPPEGQKKKKEDERLRQPEEEVNMRTQVKRLLDDKLFQPERNFERKNQIRRQLRLKEHGQPAGGEETSHAVFDLHVVSFINENPTMGASRSCSRPTSRSVSRCASRPLSRQASPTGSSSNLHDMSAMVRTVSDAYRLASSLQHIRAQREREGQEKSNAEASSPGDLVNYTREPSTRKPDWVATQPSTPTLSRSSFRHLERSSSDTSEVKAVLQKVAHSIRHRSHLGDTRNKQERPQSGIPSSTTDIVVPEKNKTFVTQHSSTTDIVVPEKNKTFVTRQVQKESRQGDKNENENQHGPVMPGVERPSVLSSSCPSLQEFDCSQSVDTAPRSCTPSSISLSVSRSSLPAIPDLWHSSESDSDSDADKEVKMRKNRSDSADSLHKSTQTSSSSREPRENERPAALPSAGAMRPRAEAGGSEDEGISSADALNSPLKDEDDSDFPETPVVRGASGRAGVAGASQPQHRMTRSQSVRASLLEVTNLLSDLKEWKAATDKCDNETETEEEQDSHDKPH